MDKSILTVGKTEWNELSSKVSAEGTVLLKNENNVLPIGDEKIAVFGRTQINTMGYGDCMSFAEGFVKQGISVENELLAIYKEWTENNPIITGGYISYSTASYPEMPIDEKIVNNAAKSAEKAIIVLSRTSTENCDLAVIKGGFMLSDGEEEMIHLVCSAFKQVIVLLNTACTIELAFLQKYDNIDGVIFTGRLGRYSAIAVADILKGKINPSGKLPFTMAKNYNSYPSSGHFGQHEGGLIQDYEEDIFVGYRYFDTFSKESDVVFPFGYGLSYTNFEVSNVTSQTKNGNITVSATVTNVGDVSGREVLEVYFSAPQMANGAKLSKPFKELCGFEKTRELQPGESETLSITFPISQMASYDDIGVLGNKSVFVMENGEYKLFVSTNGKQLYNAGTYYESETRIIEQCHSIETTLPKRLLANGEFEKLPQPLFDSNRPIGISPNDETVISVSLYCNCDIELKESLKELNVGDSIEYKLLPGICGRYIFSLGIDIPKYFKVSLDDLELNGIESVTDGSVEITLPLKVCNLKLTAISSIPDIKELSFKKITVETVINSESKSIVEAKDMYEGSFYINLENYIEDDGSVDCCITNIFLRGMYAMYKLNVKKEGYYNISFRYSYTGETADIGEIMTLIVSNVIYPVNNSTIYNTCKKDEPRKFFDSDAVSVFLPNGTVYFRIASQKASADVPFPDLSKIIFTYIDGQVEESPIDNTSENKDMGFASKKVVWTFDDIEHKGIQLKEVYEDPSKLDIFLEQLSNEELAKIVSGDSKNAVIYGGVGCTHPIMERGIPPVQTVDSPTDLSFGPPWCPPKNPSSLILTASFDKELYEYYGDVMGDAANEFSVGFWLAPAINILRNPCGGRNGDYSSEDPYLSGIYAKYVIDGVNKHNVGAILKHYCANNTEFERLKSNSRVSERALREIYIKAFEYAVKNSNVLGIMTSYNNVNDVKVCVDSTLCTAIPRDEWGWEGTFMTDWWNDSLHADEIKAGHDIKMTNGDIEGITEALDSGELTREQVYVCARRTVKLLLKLKVVTDSF